jgi:hypothetical protein
MYCSEIYGVGNFKATEEVINYLTNQFSNWPFKLPYNLLTNERTNEIIALAN